MAQSKKYAGLLDLVCLYPISARTATYVLLDKDQAPEIYETPDLTDDGSTNQVRRHLREAGNILTRERRPQPSVLHPLRLRMRTADTILMPDWIVNT